MFRKVMIPSFVKLSGPRTFTSLTRSVATRVNSVRPSVLANRLEIRPVSLSDLKIAPYAFLHTQSTAPSAAVTELIREEIDDVVVPAIEPVVEKKRFDAIEAIHPFTQKAIQKVFKYEEMSSVQDAVLSKLPNQQDMFVKAKTGTGKTLAFLMGALETATAGQKLPDMKHFEGTTIMVISPTRELANQIADEAKKLVSYYPFKVHCMVGGDSKRRQIMNLERHRCDIVVATPGRLNDMLSSVPRFKKMCENLKVLILDEADQLLDMGFKAELQRILNQIPEKRQTMLFSATISRDIRENLGKFALSPDYDLIDTVGKDDVNTNINVKQSALVAPFQDQVSVIRDCLSTHEAALKGKVIVFLPTTKATMVYSNIFKHLMPDRQVYEIHSKKNQDQRSRIADRFRKSRESSILFTSDVSARGVDYPGVTLVLQVGVPSTREQYIHRLGRTGRAGREGEGIILLAPFEKAFLQKEVSDLPIELLESPVLSEEETTETNALANRALNAMDEEMVREVYTAFLGYYAGRMPTLGERRSTVIPEANKFLTSLGVTDIPYLSPRFMAQLGLSERGGGSGGRGGFNRDRNGGDRGFSRGGSRDFDNRRGNSFNDRDGGRGGFKSGFRSRDDGFRSRDDSFRSRDDSFRSRDDSFRSRDDGFKSRDDGFKSRDGGFKSRDGGFKSRGGDDGFKKPRIDYNRRGKFNRKDDF